MSAAAPEAHPLTSNDGSDMTEEDWNAEAADMLEEVLKTQKEVMYSICDWVSSCSSI